jgi:hypothetical protein
MASSCQLCGLQPAALAGVHAVVVPQLDERPFAASARAGRQDAVAGKGVGLAGKGVLGEAGKGGPSSGQDWVRGSDHAGKAQGHVDPRLPLMLDMRVIFMDVPAGRWGLPSVEMETLLCRSPNPV